MKLLLLPGLDGTGVLSAHLLASLPADLRASPVSYPASLNNFDGYVQYARDAIRDADENTVLAAESFSGPIAIEILRKPPANLRAVVLVVTFAQTPSPMLLAFAKRLPAILMRAFSGLVLDCLCLTGGARKKTAWRIREVVQLVPPALIKPRLNILLSLPADLQAVLGRRELPMLFIRPGHDRLVSKKYFEQIERILPAASVVTVAGPHFLPQCCPQECADVMLEFIRCPV